MKFIRKINNNFVLAEDSKGKSVIVAGKGVGFVKMPCEISDLSIIDDVYYNYNERYLRILTSVPEGLIEISSKIVAFAQKKLKVQLNKNLIFVLADHINFALIRSKKGIDFDMGITFEITYLHPIEMEIGSIGLEYINRVSKVKLPQSEAAIIAMHILEAEPHKKLGNKEFDIDRIISDIIDIIEDLMQISISENSFSYYRFATHVKYLSNRKLTNKSISSDNEIIFEQMILQFPDVYKCVLVIKRYLKEQMNWELNEEEQLYLMIHLNRIKEDCNL